MKIQWRIAVLMLVGAFCSAFFFGNVKQEATPVLHDLSGNAVPVAAFRGKWVIITYWAPWCPICVREVAELNKFYQRNHDPHVLFYGVDFDRPSIAGLREAVQELDIRFPVLIEDPSAVWQLETQDSIPVTFIISPRGTVAKIIYGPNTEQSLLNTLHELQR